MPKALQQYLQQWCQDNGWSDLFLEQCQFWAFPPGGVMPSPLPACALEGFHANRSMSGRDRWLNGASVLAAIGAIVLTVWTLSPLPLVCAFVLCAVSTAMLEEPA